MYPTTNKTFGHYRETRFESSYSLLNLFLASKFLVLILRHERVYWLNEMLIIKIFFLFIIEHVSRRFVDAAAHKHRPHLRPPVETILG